MYIESISGPDRCAARVPAFTLPSLLCIKWVIKETTNNRQTGIQWSLTEQLEDLDFADDLALMTHTHQQMQEESGKLEETAALL